LSKSGSDAPSLAERKLDDLDTVFAALTHEQRRNPPHTQEHSRAPRRRRLPVASMSLMKPIG
jgi:hypothetical protein